MMEASTAGVFSSYVTLLAPFCKIVEVAKSVV